jgi:DNA repair exonuclease SbcCD ATPase subunit
VKENVKMLVAAFEDEDQVGLSTVPAIAKEMLGSVIACALGAGAAEDERHTYQVKIAAAVGEVLTEVVKVWEGKVVEAHNGVADAEKTRMEKANVSLAAESTLETKSKETDAAQEALVAAKQALADAKTGLETAKTEVDTFDIQLLKKESELEKVKACMEEDFGKLKDGPTWESAKEKAAGEKKHLGAISTLLKQLHADTSLMSALQSALVKKPEERGSFDTMAIGQLENILTEKVAEHEKVINNKDTIKAEKEAGVTTAETTLATCEAGKTSSEEALDAAKKAQKEAQAALKEAKKAVDEQDDAVEEAKETATDAESSLEDAKKHVEGFNFLLSRPSKLPEPEPIAVEEEAPAEEAPAVVEEPAEPAM